MSAMGTPDRTLWRRDALASLAVLALAAVLITWAKWWPYAHKLPAVADSGVLGRSILTGGTDHPPSASLSSGLEYARTYFLAIWPALLSGLLIAAAVETALPDRWLLATLRRDGTRSGLVGGLLALTTMMCTCCSAPVTAGLRRRRVSVPAALGYFVANPALNPAVIAFCVFVLPWQWAALRAGAGLLVVSAILAYARRQKSTVDGVGSFVGPEADVARPSRSLPSRYVSSLTGLAVRLLPEYVLLVVALGAIRTWLFPLNLDGAPVVLVVLALVLAGTLLPIPTAGEVAVVAALLAAGAGSAVAGALLITLPALSLPSLLMVRRAFPRRVLAVATGVVVLAGVATAATAAALGV